MSGPSQRRGYPTAGRLSEHSECGSPDRPSTPATNGATESDTSTTFTTSPRDSGANSGAFGGPSSLHNDPDLLSEVTPIVVQLRPGDRIPKAADFRRDPPRRFTQTGPLPSPTTDPQELRGSREFALVWEHQVAPFLVEFLPTCLKSPPGEELDESYSVDVFWSDKPTTAAVRVVHVTSAQEKSRAWRIMVAESIIKRLPDPYRHTTRFLFFRGRVERISASYAHGDNRDDYVCAPTRPHFEASPSIGASIGIECDTTASATFGGRISLRDGSGKAFECFLTCSHLFEDQEDEVVITQPSPQEAVLLRERVSKITSLLNNEDLLDHHVLEFRKEMRECEEILEAYPEAEEMRLGNLLALSGHRSVDCPDGYFPAAEEVGVPANGKRALVERDWAVGCIYNSRSGKNLLPSDLERWVTDLTRKQPRPAIGAVGERDVCRKVGKPRPGERVYALGRTSGLQRGRISLAPSIVVFSGRPAECYNREWAVQQLEAEDEAQWVSHGIGLPGDSGSWLFSESDVLYGMVWGRNAAFGEKPRKALFTPILDVFDDIVEILGCDPPTLPYAVPAAGLADPSQISLGIHTGMETNPPYPAQLEVDSAFLGQESDALLDSPASHFDDSSWPSDGPVRSSTKSRSKLCRLSRAMKPAGGLGQIRGGYMLAMRNRIV
ncbi:MAG: DNA polymerase epsilon catalytic subunit [Geoglossum umbratile]|nr:MAG: DNA polymerase epsilon catalytic subunit [Geoglossum umbratile]